MRIRSPEFVYPFIFSAKPPLPNCEVDQVDDLLYIHSLDNGHKSGQCVCFGNEKRGVRIKFVDVFPAIKSHHDYVRNICNTMVSLRIGFGFLTLDYTDPVGKMGYTCVLLTGSYSIGTV